MSELAERREQKRAELTEAALRVFYRDGFTRAKIDDIAAEAGMGKGTVYLYADSKVNLLLDAVRLRVLPILSDVEALRTSHNGSASDLLRLQVRRFFSELLKEDRHQLILLILSEGPQLPELMSFYTENVILPAQQAIRQTLIKGMETGEFRTLPVEGLPRTILGGALATGLWRAFFGDAKPEDIHDYCELHLDVILGGIRA